VVGGLEEVVFGASNIEANGSDVVDFEPPPRFTKVKGSAGFWTGNFYCGFGY
jgi:hypothetical protein